MTEKLSVIGLGKLGASMAAAFASRGFVVIGVDVDSRSVETINSGKAPVQETNLEQLISENKDRISATLSFEKAILTSNISFVIVPTPSDERGAFSLEYAAAAFREIGKALAKKDEYHNIVLTSTVLPGSMRQFLLPILEKESGKKCGKDFGLCYSPEFIALGSIIRDFLNPDFTLIGEFDEKSGKQLEEIYSKVVTNNAKSVRMNFENAELTKISINSYVTTKITFANMLAEICEKLPNGNVDVVTSALGLDKRIGKHYLTGAVGYGGPCFPRDNVALTFIAERLKVDAKIPNATNIANRSFADKFVDKVSKLIEPPAAVGVLGLAYKPFSHITEESQGLEIAQKLAEKGFNVAAFDPLSEKMQFNRLDRKISIENDLKKLLRDVETVIITTPDPIFAALKLTDFDDKNVLIIDCWRILHDKFKMQTKIKYIGIGFGNDDEINNQNLKSIWETNKQEFHQTNNSQ